MVSCHFHGVLHALATLAKEMIKQLSLDNTPLEVLRNKKYYPSLKDCIFAINGIHIPAVVTAEKAIPYTSGRKNDCIHVMAACSFDMHFTWMSPGWE